MKTDLLDIDVDDVRVRVASINRDGAKLPIVLLHGFGSTKEDFADMMRHPALRDRRVIAFDAPGCGESTCNDTANLSISFLVRTAELVFTALNLGRFHLAGHSMGGLTALMFADQNPETLSSFINIEGNLAPEDCFLSRQIIDHPANSPEEFLDQFVERVRKMPGYANPKFAAGIRSKVRADAVEPILKSIVELSDSGILLDKFLALPCPRMFTFGEESSQLSYLPQLTKSGVEMAKIAHSGHFPMYSNPASLWQRIGAFTDAVDDRTR